MISGEGAGHAAASGRDVMHHSGPEATWHGETTSSPAARPRERADQDTLREDSGTVVGMQTHRTGYLWVTLSPTRSGFWGPQHHAQGEPLVTRTSDAPSAQSRRYHDTHAHDDGHHGHRAGGRRPDVCYDIRHSPVVEHSTLVGMISDRDLEYMLPRPERIFRTARARRLAVSVSA